MLRMLNPHKYIRNVKNFPKMGVNFKDISPLLGSPAALGAVVARMATACRKSGIQAICAIESRGFLFAAPVAHKLKLPLVMVRKFGKLPFKCYTVKHALEYGASRLQIHKDSLRKNARVAIIDDVLATGGTIMGACNLVQKCDAKPVLACFLLEIRFLKGGENVRAKMPRVNVMSCLSV